MRHSGRLFLASFPLAAFLTIAAPAFAQDLEAKVQALEQELKLLRVQIEAQVEAANAKAEAALAKAETAAAEQPAAGPKFKMKGPTPTFESADGRYSLQITGRVHYDTALYDQDAVPTGRQDVRIASDLNSGTNFRRARLGVKGKIAGDWRYHLEFNGGGDPDDKLSVHYAYLQYAGLKPLTFTAGRHKAATGFDEVTSSNDITFIERSLGHNAQTSPFSPPANGFSVKAHGEMWNASTGVWYGDINDDAMDEFFYWNGRVAFAPVQSDGLLLHLGAHSSYMFEPEQDGKTNVTFSDRPEMRVSDVKWVSASSQGIFANDKAWNYGVELAGKYNNFWLNGEVNWFGMDQTRDPAGSGPAGPDLDFLGYYVQGGWIITGETKPYKMSKAAWGGVKPADPFDLTTGGWGAWELALRYSHVDLNDHENLFRTDATGASHFVGARGGEESNFTVGINWYVNDWIRFMFNYIHADVDRLTVGQSAGAGGLSSGDTFDIFALRAQFKW